MISLQALWTKYKKSIFISSFSLFFSLSLIYNTPIWILANMIGKYSSNRLQLCNTQGTFWHGSGLLIARDARLLHPSPLILVNWQITLGIRKFVNINFTTGDKLLAEIFLDKTGITINKLDISLSLTQVAQLFDTIKDLGLSGNANITASNININKRHLDGDLLVRLMNISSSISRVNPLGSYNVHYDLADGALRVSSDLGDALILDGVGNVNSHLNLKARVNPDKQADMLQFITVMGAPQADGSYQLGVF